jgi:hypothetical protein
MGLGRSHLYRSLMRRHRHYMLQKYLWRFGLPVLAATASCTVVWAFLSFDPLSGLGPTSSPEIRVWRPGGGAALDRIAREAATPARD